MERKFQISVNRLQPGDVISLPTKTVKRTVKMVELVEFCHGSDVRILSLLVLEEVGRPMVAEMGFMVDIHVDAR